ncbi:MAG: hypothetical protein M1819_005480 [Sarea resinae]|nr:MAG: hypothetical protein M1819_005480 [Sarea resinae]
MLVRFFYLLVLVNALFGSTTGSPVTKRDADFESVRTKLDRDHSGKPGDPKEKYFHESVFHPHYDGRFAARPLSYNERRTHLTALMQTYLAAMADIGAETWIMHGSLLGWWWNRKIMPWDSDIDVQVSEETMQFLAGYYNMTTHHYKTPRIPEGRDYLLEINPSYVNRGIEDKLNVIDARWVDMDTGLFIDITTVRRNETAIAEGIEGALMCKDRHHYLEKDLFPLRDSVFEDMPVKIPFAYAEVLEEEYGKKSLTQTVFEKHKFNPKSMEWEPLK